MAPSCFGRARAENGREQQQGARRSLNTPPDRCCQQVHVAPRFALSRSAIFRTSLLSRVYTEVCRRVSERDYKVVVARGRGFTLTIDKKIVGLSLSALIAFAIGKLVFAPLFFVLWPGLYLGWHFLDRHRKSPGLRAPRSIEGTQSPAVAARTRRSMPGRILLVAGLVIVGWIAVSMLFLFIARESGHRKAEKARSTVHPGMNVAEVLHSVTGWVLLGASSDAPETAAAHLSAVSLGFHPENNTFIYFDATKGANLELSESETLVLLRQKVGDAYGWRFRFTFVGSTPQHFSFKVEFDKDGRVREVKPVYGWD
jgi:hypothetical protein